MQHVSQGRAKLWNEMTWINTAFLPFCLVCVLHMGQQDFTFLVVQEAAQSYSGGGRSCVDCALIE